MPPLNHKQNSRHNPYIGIGSFDPTDAQPGAFSINRTEQIVNLSNANDKYKKLRRTYFRISENCQSKEDQPHNRFNIEFNTCLFSALKLAEGHRNPLLILRRRYQTTYARHGPPCGLYAL